MTAISYPGLNFFIFLIVNFFLVWEESSSSVKFSTLLALIMLWFGISVPLVFLGSFIGYKKKAIKNSTKPHPIPKFIPV